MAFDLKDTRYQGSADPWSITDEKTKKKTLKKLFKEEGKTCRDAIAAQKEINLIEAGTKRIEAATLREDSKALKQQERQDRLNKVAAEREAKRIEKEEKREIKKLENETRRQESVNKRETAKLEIGARTLTHFRNTEKDEKLGLRELEKDENIQMAEVESAKAQGMAMLELKKDALGIWKDSLKDQHQKDIAKIGASKELYSKTLDNDHEFKMAALNKKGAAKIAFKKSMFRSDSQHFNFGTSASALTGPGAQLTLNSGGQGALMSGDQQALVTMSSGQQPWGEMSGVQQPSDQVPNEEDDANILELEIDGDLLTLENEHELEMMKLKLQMQQMK